MAEQLLPINLWLAGRTYRIRIHPEEEAAVRRAVKQADEKIGELRLHYAGRDDQDFIAMCLLMYAANSATAPVQHVLQEEISAMMQRIDAALSEEG